MFYHNLYILRRTLVLLLLTCGLCVGVSAQSTERAPEPAAEPALRLLEGVVVDQNGAPIAGATIALSIAGGKVSAAISKSDGSFRFSILAPGPATIEVLAPGFAPLVKNNVGADGDNQDNQVKLVLLPGLVQAEVTVTGSIVPERVDAGAASVAVLTQQRLAATAAPTIDAALRQLPGFSLFRRSSSANANPTSSGVSLRGLGASGASRALVLDDGVPLNDPFGGWIYWGRAPAIAIERVEVLRGGASRLYGSSALSGVINIVPRESATHPSLLVQLSGGSQREADAALHATGALHGWSGSLTARRFETRGYIPVTERNRGAIDAPAGVASLILTARAQRRLGQTGSINMRVEEYGERRTNGTALQTNRTHLREFSSGTTWSSQAAGFFTLRGTFSTQVFDQIFTSIADNRNSEALTRRQRVPSQAETVDAYWLQTFRGKHTLVAGFAWNAVHGASDEIGYANRRATLMAGAGGRSVTVAGFAQNTFEVSQRWRLTGGVRVDRWLSGPGLSSQRTFASSQFSALEFAAVSKTAYSPYAALLFHASDAVAFNLSATRAFRAPTLNELYRSFRLGNVLTIANPRPGFETVTSAEAGVNVTRFARRLHARANFFWSSLQQPIANVTISVTPSLITRERRNLGRVRSLGTEVDLDLRIAKRWSLSGGYQLADSRVAKFPAVTQIEGNFVPQVARQQATLQLQFQHHGLTAATQMRLSGAQFEDDLNELRLAPYFTADAFLAQRISKRAELFIATENLTGRRYEVGRTPTPSVGPPATLRAGIRLTLGSAQ